MFVSFGEKAGIYLRLVLRHVAKKTKKKWKIGKKGKNGKYAIHSKSVVYFHPIILGENMQQKFEKYIEETLFS